MKKNKIPHFKNKQEEAQFWDTHDITEYLDEVSFADVEFSPRENKVEVITIRIESKLKSKLEELARSKGLNLSTLARISLIDKLKEVYLGR